MKRELDADLIRPEKLLSSSDTAGIGTDGCKNCCACCRMRGSAIVLDAWDVQLLKNGLNFSFEGLLAEKLITLAVIDGVVLPCLPVKEEEDECLFLKENGRCAVYDFRPGICRMFPLARIYHPDGSFSYFLQDGECEKPGGTEIRISAWLGYENVKEYESFVRTYHDALVGLRNECAACEKTEDAARLQMDFLQEWFF